MIKKILSCTVFACVLFIACASAAITCDKTQIVSSVISGAIPSSQTLSCTSTDASNSVSIVKNGPYFSIDSSFIAPNATRIIQITFDSLAPIGNNFGAITFGDGSIVGVFMQVNASQQVSTGCQINPSIISYSQAIQQGTKLPLSMITFSPTNCPTALQLTPSSVNVQGGIITPDGQKPISIASVVQDGVNIVIDTTGLTTQQTYSSMININAFSKQFQIPFIIVVTAGSSQPSNASTDNIPSCSLTNTVLSTNNTYSLVCSNIQPDITIVPSVDSSYIIGNGVETSSNQYVWKFKPLKFGNTNITANFYFRSAPFGSPYHQEVKISSSGQSIPGTFLSVLFTPGLDIATANDDIAIQLIDNKTGNLVSNPEIIINGHPLKANGSVFFFDLEQGKTYNLRGISPGYDDIVRDIGLTSKIMNITLNPKTPDSSTPIIITTSANNASLFIDSNKVSNPYNGVLSEGLHEILAVKDGFFNVAINLTVDRATSINYTTEFKKGAQQIFIINKNTTWSIEYQKDYASPKQVILSGTGTVGQYTPSDTGIYNFVENGKVVDSREIKGWDGTIVGLSWWWALLIIIAIGIIIKMITGSSNSSSGAIGIGYTPPPTKVQ